MMNPRTINYGRSFNWCFNDNPNLDANYNGEGLIKRSYVPVNVANEPRKNDPKERSMKVMVSSEKLANKLFTEHGIQPVFQEHTEIPLDKFIEVLSDEIKISQSREKSLRPDSSRDSSKRTSSTAPRTKIDSRGTGGSSHAPIREEKDQVIIKNSPIQKLSQNSRQNRLQHNEKVHIQKPVILITSRDLQESSFVAEIRKTTELTKNFVTSQVSKAKDLFSFADTSSKVTRNSAKRGMNNNISKQSENLSKNSLNSVGNNKVIAFEQTRSDLHERNVNADSNGSVRQKNLAPLKQECKEIQGGAKTSSNSHARIEKDSKGSTFQMSLMPSKDTNKIHKMHSSTESKRNPENSSPARDEANNDNGHIRRIPKFAELHAITKPQPNKNMLKETKLNISCAVSSNDARPNKAVNNKPPKASPRTSENHISVDSLVIDLCHGSEKINVLPGISMGADMFSSDVLKKYQKSGSFIVASDASTGSVFRMDIPEELFNAKKAVLFDSKPSLLSFLLQVLNEPCVDFVPLPAKSAAYWVKKSSEQNGTSPPLNRSTSVRAENEQENQLNNEIKKISKKNSSNFSKQRSTEAGLSRYNTRVEPPSQSKDVEEQTYILESENNCPIMLAESGDDVSSSDTSSGGSLKSNDIQSGMIKITNKTSSMTCNESHCLNYKLNANEIDDVPKYPYSSCSLELGNRNSSDTLLADSQRPVMKTCSTSSKIRYKMYYHPTGGRGTSSKTRVASGQNCCLDNRKLSPNKNRKFDEKIASKQSKKIQPNNKVSASTNRTTTTIGRQRGGTKVSRNGNPLSISYPLAFDNKSNIFTFKEEPNCPLNPVASSAFNCPLYDNSSSEDLLQETSSTCSWSSHCQRSHTDLKCVQKGVGVRRSESQSSWRTVTNEKSETKPRMSRHTKVKRKSSEKVNNKSDLQTMSKQSSKVIESSAVDIHTEQSITSSQSQNEDVVSNGEKEVVVTELNQRLLSSSSSGMLMYLQASSRSLTGCAQEGDTQVDLTAKSWAVLHYLAQFSPTFRLLASNPLLGDVILLLYITLFGSKIENGVRLKKALSNSVIRRDLIQRRNSV